jgi:predicted permease
MLIHDIRYACRLWARQPGFTVVAVFILALGIGANTAMFSVVDAVLLKPLGYQDPDRLVSVATAWRNSNGARNPVSAPDFHDWHDQATVFDGLAAYAADEGAVGIDAAAQYAVVTRVTSEFFRTLGARAAFGRLPTDAEQTASGPSVAVISAAFAQRFGGGAAAVDRTIRYRQRVFTVIGVLAPGVDFPDATDAWVPWGVAPESTSRSAHNYRAVGRLRAGVTLAQAQSQMDGIAARLEQAYPVTNAQKGVGVDRLQDRLVSNVRTTLQLLMAVVAVVLLIACANISNLLLARATSRTRELAMRAAIGASRMTLVRQLVTESSLLALMAGAAGVLLASWGVKGLVAIAPPGIPRLNEVAIDWRVLTFVAAVSIAATLVFGLAPAWHISRVDLNEVLKAGARGQVGAGRGGRLRSALVVFETAAAVVLVVAAALLLRSFAALSQVDLGFQPEHLLLLDTTVQTADIDAAKGATRFYSRLLLEAKMVPGVRSVAAVRGVPTQVRSNGGYWLLGGPGPEETGVRSPQAIFTVVSPGYFETMGIPLLRGRDFSGRDAFDGPPVAVINDALARRSFPGADPVGQQIRSGLDRSDFMTIVGVVADVRAADPSRPPQPQLYLPHEQHPSFGNALTVVARTTADPLALADVLSQKIRALDPDVPIKVSTMDSRLSAAVSTPRFRSVLLGAFAAVALLLAAAGLYGLMTFTIAQRTSEIGLRLALGAEPSDIVRMTLASGLRLTGAGILAGLALAAGATRLISAMLFSVTQYDPLVFLSAPAILLLAAIAASIIPALRASRIDPIIALRTD